MATLIQVRQADDLSARVKALEDYLAEPDSSCVKECGDTWDSCADKCPIDFTSEYSDFAFDACLSDCDKDESLCNAKCDKSFPPK
ncbi:hypothetical protein LEL_09522 [Akanthomyces lecanii RCEF 1005]|uniref:Uncharacterized protein n=2 Tax=Akanthomyces TaxID=150366 RepID=A0A168C4R6_CORDF|nr:hypothetical protein LEL_09522 [Akanthomyces lecanii RCEF 1005]